MPLLLHLLLVLCLCLVPGRSYVTALLTVDTTSDTAVLLGGPVAYLCDPLALLEPSSSLASYPALLSTVFSEAEV